MEDLPMRATKILPILFVAGVLLAAPGCSTQQAEHKTNEVTGQTGGTVDSVLDAVGSVIMYPVHLVGDLFT
jgi:acetamidase/formamidase